MHVKKHTWREFGKYLLDISKYIITILILGYILQMILAKEVLKWAVLAVASANAVIWLIIGLIFINIGGNE